MAATVTIDKAYFETLLRRAEFHISGKDVATPPDLLTVTIPKHDHDNLLRMAQEYTMLKDALYRAGIASQTLEVLIRGDDGPHSPTDGRTNGSMDLGGVPINQSQLRLFGTSKASYDFAPTPPTTYRPARGYTSNGYNKDNSGSNRQESSFSPEDNSYPSDVDKDDRLLTAPPSERHHIARNDQRTILIRNLSDRVTHKDIVDVVRGGALLDVYLRGNDKSASVSFVEGAAARAFMNYAKRNDLYIRGKRAELAWNDRQFVLPGHVAGKIHGGATRNLIVRGVHPNITAERIREDLDHIHNLIVIDITFQQENALISLNSVHNALFARTCMMSRAIYKGARIEWYLDGCAQALPRIQHAPKKEAPTQSTKKIDPMINRFQMLNIDGTEDGSEEDEKADLINCTPMSPGTHWAASTFVA